jgi:hypothetical protein
MLKIEGNVSRLRAMMKIGEPYQEKGEAFFLQRNLSLSGHLACDLHNPLVPRVLNPDV